MELAVTIIHRFYTEDSLYLFREFSFSHGSWTQGLIVSHLSLQFVLFVTHKPIRKRNVRGRLLETKPNEGASMVKTVVMAFQQNDLLL